jgi:hypothetical protein
MANIDGYSSTNTKAGVSASTYQQVDQQQQRDFERALKISDPSSGTIKNDPAVRSSTPGNVADGVRAAARAQKIIETGLPGETSSKAKNHSDEGKSNDGERAAALPSLGRVLDVQA